MNRTRKSLINTGVGFFCTVLSSLLSFVLQALFIRLLGLEYSGINSLFNDILKMLNIVDMGISNAVLFRLYKTIATQDSSRTEMYMTAYRKVCQYIGFIVGLVGLAFIPFLEFFIKEKPMFTEPLWSLYIIVLGTSVISHIVDYKNVLFIAHQDRYYATIIEYCSLFLRNGLQIVALAVFKSIYLYLLASVFTTALRGLISGILSWRKYHLSWNTKTRLLREEKEDMFKDVGTLAVYKFCRTLHVTIDTFLISKFISVSTTAIYGSVTILTTALENLLGTLNDGIIASVGDLYATGQNERVDDILGLTTHLVFLLYGTCSVVLASFLVPFTTWWIGYSLPTTCIFVLVFNLYVNGQNANIATFRNAMGLYRKGWKRPAITALLNLLFSFILVQKIGLIGCLIGTAISNVLTIVWYDPYIIYKYAIKRSCLKYMLRYMAYIAIVFFDSALIFSLSKHLPIANSLPKLFLHGSLYTVCGLAVLVMFGCLFPVQKELFERGRKAFRRR